MSSQHLVVPLTLQSISPTLAAFHVNRMGLHLRSGGEEEEKERERVIDDLKNTHCSGCGRFQLDGSADTRLVRDNKHRSTSVILQKSCRSCGLTRRTPLVKGGAVPLKNHRKRNQQSSNCNPPGTRSEMEGKATRTQTPPIAPAPPQLQVGEPTTSASDGTKKSKNRKARSGLQELLERKRKQDQVNSAGTSLASFLQAL